MTDHPARSGEPDDDPYLWLEDVTGEAALEWVRARNAEGADVLAGGARFAELRTEIREVLDADDRIPYVTRRDGLLYNFWQDAEHPRGLWRRTTPDSYRRPDPDWDVLLDVDALAAAEEENWVWQGAVVLRPGFDRALLELSRGGADAAVVREFDLVTRRFVADGFTLGEAKSRVGWIDRDRIYVGTDTGPGSMTDSGYPRTVREWRRGTPLAEAPVVFEGDARDVSVHAWHDPTEGFERDLVVRALDFFRTRRHLRTARGLVRLDVPEDAVVAVHREWLLVRTRSAWSIGSPGDADGPGTTHPPGTLLAAPVEDWLAGSRAVTVLFAPDAHTSLEYHAWTRHHLLLGTLRDVRTEIRVLTPGPDGWRAEPLAGVPELGASHIQDTDPDVDDDYLLATSGFLRPATLDVGTVASGTAEVLKRAPELFDAAGHTTEQYFATSADGTAVPYFVVRGPAGGPVLLNGYGGFEISLTPAYSGTIGRGWLARGGSYAVANIRGGGEYGPAWHTAALREHRPRAYQDFAAVAADLTRRGLATPERLGVIGGSNGGLLMGVMLTRYPELFGAVVCQVPLLDMLRYHRLLAGASWMAEYGDPDDPDDRAFLAAYSPYQNLRADTATPPTLFVTSTRDDRVHPGHARKMVARMLEQGHDVTYYENIEGGHGAAADNAQRAHMWALVFEYLHTRLS